MRPARFAYFQPETLDEAVGFLQAGGERARVLAGGQSLLAQMNRRQERPTALVDLTRLRHLRYLRHEAGSLRIGALTTHRDLETTGDRGVNGDFPVLPEAARLIGHLPIRTRGTFGGSLAQADPCAEWCLLAVLLDAEILVHGPNGRRTVPADEFFTAPGTSLRPHEILVETRFDRPAPTAALVEFSVQDGNLPLVAAAAAVDLAPDGSVGSARIALAGVADRPVRYHQVEQALLHSPADRGLPDRAARLLADRLDPVGDHRADADYRRHLATTLVARALRASLARTTPAPAPEKAETR
jgi:carbon-monoxide dehydrogenase medium subunit